MPQNRNSSSPLFVLVAFIVAVAALYVAKEILLPISLAILLSFLLTPLANRLERWGLPRIPATIAVAGISFAVLAAIMWTVALQAFDLSTNLPKYQDQVFEKIRSVSGESARFSQFTTFLQDLSEQLTADSKLLPPRAESGDPTTKMSAVESPMVPLAGPSNADLEQSNETDSEPNDSEPIATAPLETAEKSTTVLGEKQRVDEKQEKKQPETMEVRVIESPLTQIRSWLGPLVAPLSSAGLVVVLVVFMLLERENQRNRLIQLFGTSNVYATTEALSDAGGRVMRFLRMQFLVNAGYGLSVAIALTVLGIPNGIMWGVLGFMLRFLPYIGPILAAVMPIVVSAAVSPGWTTPMLVLGWYIVLELVLNNVVEPWLYGSSIGVSAVGIIVSAIFWTWIWGPLGLVLAMPLTVCLVVLAQYVPQLRFVTVLLGDQPPLSPAERTYQRLLAMDDNEISTLARKYVKTSTLANYYDEVLLPALYLTERDRHDGQLTDEQAAFVEETVEDLVDELGVTAEATAAEETTEDTAVHPSSVRVLCVPLQDSADQASTVMLSQLLRAEGIEAEVGSPDSLTNEIVDEVEERRTQVVVISIMPPSSPRNSRLLYRRLRERYPDLPIIIGYWNAVQGEHLEARFGFAARDHLVTSLQTATAEVRQAAASLGSLQGNKEAIGHTDATKLHAAPAGVT
jgi:predicted PurR-regulated permease PerM